MAFLYYRPISSYLQTRSELGARRAQVVALRAEKARLERRLARTTSDAALAREARRIGYVKPGERLFIVKGIAAWQRHAPRRRHRSTPRYRVARGRSRRSSSARSAAARARSGASLPAARSALPAVTEQEPYDDAGAPFPTTYYLTCPSSRRRGLPARGGRRRRALERRRRGEPRAARPISTPATAAQRRVRRDARRGPDGRRSAAHRSTRGSAARAIPRQLKCLHAHVAFALAQPGYGLGDARARRDPRADGRPDRCCSPPGGGGIVSADLDGARRDWEDGYRRFELAAARRGPGRAAPPPARA